MVAPRSGVQRPDRALEDGRNMIESTLGPDRTRESIHLIRKYQEGESGALGVLFARYYKRVQRIVAIRAAALGHRSAEVDDVVQETFLAAMRSFDRFEVREEGRLINWLARIAEHKLIDALKRDHAPRRDCGREVSLEGLQGSDASRSSVAWDLTADSTQVAERAERNEMTAILDECLAGLDERQREVILLRDYAGGSFKFIAEEMGCVSDEAARKTYTRARVELVSRVQGRV